MTNDLSWLGFASLCVLSSCAAPTQSDEDQAASPPSYVADPAMMEDAEDGEESAHEPDPSPGSTEQEQQGDVVAHAAGVCTRCTGPGDWGPGDYPPALRRQAYLEIEAADGRGNSVIRGYKVRVPKSYDPNTPLPLLFSLHGLMQNAAFYSVDGAGWHDKAEKEGFILVMPTGNLKKDSGRWAMAGSWNGGECCGGAAAAKLDDVGLIRAIVEEVGTHVNVDLTRVYATGLSTGAFLSYRLACEASDLFVAIAPAAGAIGTPELAPMGAGNAAFNTCKPTHPVAVLATHGTKDPLVPYRFFEPSLQYIAAANGCSHKTEAASVPVSGGDTSCFTYTGCPAGVEVTGCSVKGGGHCWFGSRNCGTGDPTGIGNLIVGANSDTLVNTDAVWAFLSRVSRP